MKAAAPVAVKARRAKNRKATRRKATEEEEVRAPRPMVPPGAASAG